jgi:DNA polymerase-4
MKKIIHIDADCFYAAIEMRENLDLCRLSVAVGGDPGRRGVGATCNYNARRLGIRSAMDSAYAKKLCPVLVIIPPRIDFYKRYSRELLEIFSDYTATVESLPLDEAFLDVSDSEHCMGSATLIAEEIRHKIALRLGITVSAGVAPVKLLEKIASK